MTTWIIIAEASRARIVSVPFPGAELRPVREFEHARSRAKVSDLVADQRGRVYKGAGGVASSMQPHSDPKQVEAQRFAHELAEALRDGRDARAYDALVLVAPPHFLGLLRAELTGEVAETVLASVDKDYTHVSTLELAEHLKPILDPAPQAIARP